MTIEELRKLIGEKSQALATLKAKVLGEGSTKDDLEALTKATEELKGLTAKLEALHAAEKAEAASAQPVVPAAPSAPKAAAQAKKDFTAVEKIGLGLQGLIFAKQQGYGQGQVAVYKAMSELGYQAVADEFDAMMKVNSVTGAGGGFTIPPDFNPNIIEILNPVTAFLRGGPEEMPMPTGSYTQPGQASQPTASYRGEAQAIAVSDLTFREINMKARLLSSMVPVTNQIIRYSATQIVPFVQRSMATVMGQKMDAKAFVGTGVGSEPLGILRIDGHYSTPAFDSATPTAQQIDSSARKLLDRIALYPALQIKLAWVMAQRTFGYLQDLRDANSNYIYPSLQGERPTWKGYPVLVSAVIATNGGVGTNESEIALVSFGNILLGITKGLELAVSDVATVNGVSMFETDQTAVRALSEHDWTARHVENVMRLTGVKWGAA